LLIVDGPDGQPGKSLGLSDYKNPANAIPPIVSIELRQLIIATTDLISKLKFGYIFITL
jgi:hypothetical protein